ncbi:MAG: nitroreductase family protein, partial [Patescibacteria group bacterium]|nr:nitroreductase family protein [Patescibacteria group bacterium]
RCCSKVEITHNGKPNRFALYDTGMAVANLSLQAMAFDIYIHQMGGYSVEKVREYFRLADDVEPVSVMAAGFLGDGNELPPDILKKDEHRRPRKGVNDYTFKDKIYNIYICNYDYWYWSSIAQILCRPLIVYYCNFIIFHKIYINYISNYMFYSVYYAKFAP